MVVRLRARSLPRQSGQAYAGEPAVKTKPRIYVCIGHEECPRFGVPTTVYPVRINEHSVGWLVPICDHCHTSLAVFRDPNVNFAAVSFSDVELAVKMREQRQLTEGAERERKS